MENAPFLTLIAGFLLLGFGGEALVRGAVTVARVLGLPALLIGLVLVGFGTSAPELAASVDAALRDAPGIALGNIIGSNIANIFLVLGLVAIINPVRVDTRALKRDGPSLFIATLIFAVATFTGMVTRFDGTLMLLFLAAYLTVTYIAEKRNHDASATMHRAEGEMVPSVSKGLPIGLLLTVLGIAMVVAGGSFTVTAAIEIARSFNISETVIGLTIVAIGTSLPEMAVTIIAAMRGQSDIAFGNVVGSCIFNVLGIAGVTALIKPIPVPEQILVYDIWVLLAASVVLIHFASSRAIVSRGEATVLLIGYCGFLGLLFANGHTA